MNYILYYISNDGGGLSPLATSGPVPEMIQNMFLRRIQIMDIDR